MMDLLSKKQKKKLKAMLKNGANTVVKKGRQTAANAYASARPGQMAGGLMGSYTGVPGGLAAGMAVGSAVDRKIKRALAGRGSYMIGRGSYDIPTPSGSVYNDTFSHISRKFDVSSMGGDNSMIVICGREFVSKVTSDGTAEFSNNSFQVNPGLKSFFPWLAQIGANFSEYHMGQLVVEYSPLVSKMSVSSVGSLGNVIMGANYNAGAPAYGSFAEIASADHTVTGTIADTMFFGLECDPRANANDSNLYVRTGNVPSGQDIKTYDMAKFQLALDGVPTEYSAGTALGNLWVNYTIGLSKRVYTQGGTIATDTFSGGGSLNAQHPLGTAPTKHGDNSLGGYLTKNTTDIPPTQAYVFPDDYAGTVQVLFNCDCSSGMTSSPLTMSVAPGSNMSTVSYYVTAGSDVAEFSEVTATGCLQVLTLNVQPSSIPSANYIQFNAVGATGISSSFLLVQDINPANENFLQHDVPV
jgi:hypothetical protein